jgi:VCBS repeat-containing protein
MAPVPQKTSGGTTVSFGNTPQASDDSFAGLSGLAEGTLGIVTLDVLADDGGGNAKTLWSLDNNCSGAATTTNGNYSPSDLLTQDTARTADASTDTSKLGAKIWITSDGKVNYDANSLSQAVKDQLEHLGVGEKLQDSFTYAIRLGNGTLSWATVELELAGTNDGPVISVVSDGEGGDPDDSDSANLDETDAPLTASGALTVTDIDDTDEVAVSVTGAIGSVDSLYDIENNEGLDETALLAFFSVDPALLEANFDDVNNLSWAFDSDPEAFDFLQADETLTLVYTIEADDGHGLFNSTTTHEVTITITGTQDAAEFSGDDDGEVFEDGVEIATGTLVVNDDDHDESNFVSTSNLTGAYGTFTFTLATGEWSYDLDNNNLIVQGLDADDPALTETLTVTSTDGSTHDIVVTINGADEPILAPTVAAPITGTGDPNDFDLLLSGSALSTTTGATITGSPGNVNDTLHGSNVGENINPGNGDDTVYGHDGVDVINGGAGVDLLYGQAGHDNINGAGGVDTVYGGSGNDTITGSGDADTIYGGSGVDTIDGGGGNDTIVGGYGADNLTGDSAGTGDVNRFTFLSTLDTGDSITDFQAGAGGDILDFNAIGAIDNVFADTAVHANSINYFQSGADTVVWADTDGTVGTVELQITLLNTTAAALLSGNFDLA